MRKNFQGRALHGGQEVVEEALLVGFEGRARRGPGVAVQRALGTGDLTDRPADGVLLGVATIDLGDQIARSNPLPVSGRDPVCSVPVSGARQTRVPFKVTRLAYALNSAQ